MSVSVVTQLLVLESRRKLVFHTAHHNLMAGHLGQDKTIKCLIGCFYWPAIHSNVCRWYAANHECQLGNPPATPKALLHPLPLIKVPFKRIGMDLLWPLQRCM